MALQVWLPLNGNTNNQGLSNISVTNNGATVDSNGKIGKCYSFDGTNDYIQIPSMTLDLSYASICGWIKWGAFNSWSRMFDFQNSASGSTGAIGIANSGTTSTITVFGRTSSGGTLPDTSIGLSAVVNTWYHIVLTLNNTTAKVYLNGTLTKTFTLNSALGVMTLNNNYLGKSGWSADKFFQGSMNDFRIYDHCLSAKEVAEIAKGLVLHYPLNNGGFGAPNLAQNSFNCSGWSIGGGFTQSVDINDGATILSFARTNATGPNWSRAIHPNKLMRSDILSQGITISFEFMCDDMSALSDTCIVALQSFNSSGSRLGWYEPRPDLSYMVSGKWYKYSVYWSKDNGVLQLINGGTTSNADDISYYYVSWQLVKNGSVHFKKMKVELGNHCTPWIPNSSDALYTAMGLNSATEFDCSGLSNNGARTGALTYTSNSMRYNGCLTFDAKSYIKIAKPMTISNASQFTVAMWVKPESGCGGYAIVASNYNNPSSGFWMAINTEGSGTWFYNGTYAKGNALLTVGSWSHIAMVFNVGVITWYVNGTATTTSDVSSRTTQFTDYIAIGNSYTGSSWNTNFVGRISDFRMYGTALSTAQVKELYSVPQSIDKNGNLYAYEYKEV